VRLIIEQLRLRGGVACRPRCPKKEQDLQARAFHEPLRQGTLQRLPLITLYLTERCNSRCVTCDYWRHGRADMNLESVTQLLPCLVQLQTQVTNPALRPQELPELELIFRDMERDYTEDFRSALWREPDSRATADFLLPGKAYV
jgi:hypothetical protein